MSLYVGLWQFAGSGHLTFTDQPGLFLKAINDFLHPKKLSLQAGDQ